VAIASLGLFRAIRQQYLWMDEEPRYFVLPDLAFILYSIVSSYFV